MSSEQSATVDVFSPSLHGKVISWKCSINEFVNDQTVIVECENEDHTTFKILAPCAGTITNIFFPDGSEIDFADDNDKKPLACILRCQHDQFFYNMCSRCGQLDGLLNNKEYLPSFQNGDWFFLRNTIYEQSNRQKEIEYYQQKKLVLLCDLDNTLIDTTTGDFQKAIDSFSPTNVYSVPSRFKSATAFYIKIRPFAREFLETISPYYELYLYSQGRRYYIDECLKRLDPDHSFFGNRIIARGEAYNRIQDFYLNIKIKDMRTIWNCFQYIGMAIDDTVNAWDDDIQGQVLCVTRYNYWKDFKNICNIVDKEVQEFINKNKEVLGYSNTPRGIQKSIEEEEKEDAFNLYGIGTIQDSSKKQSLSLDDIHNKQQEIYQQYSTKLEGDAFLNYLGQRLVRIHHLFYQDSFFDDPQHLEKQLEEHPRTVIQVIQEDNKTLLSGCSFAFSRLYPMNQDITKTVEWEIIQKYGGEYTPTLTPQTTHLITNSRTTTDKVNEAVRRSLFVVTSNFLIDIDKYKVRFDENNYIVPGFHSACPGKESNPQAEPPSSSAEKQNKCVHHEADDRKQLKTHE